MTVNLRGVIIKETPVGESDKHLIILTKTKGKLMVRARGAKNPKSKFITAQIFTYGDFVVYCGKGFYSLTQIDLIESFYNIRLDYDILSGAFYIARLTDKFIQGEMNEEDGSALLYLVLKALQALNNKSDPENTKILFHLKLLELAGFAPALKGNILLGLNEEIPLKENTAEELAFILNLPAKKVFNYNIENRDIKNICAWFSEKLELEDL